MLPPDVGGRDETTPITSSDTNALRLPAFFAKTNLVFHQDAAHVGACGGWVEAAAKGPSRKLLLQWSGLKTSDKSQAASSHPP